MDMKKFLENPHEFARLYPITTRFGSSVAPGTAMKEKAFKVNEETENGYQIRGANRILWFRMERARSNEQAGASELMLAEEQTKDFAPTYWLPWAENQIYRITLRPSGKSKKDIDPDYFFTAPVNGCSVFVEGPPEQPTVYHANAQTHGGEFNQETAKAFKKLQRQKADYMRERYLAFSSAHEKQGKGVTTAGPDNPREVNTTHYFNRGFHEAFTDDLKEVVEKLVEKTKGIKVVIDQDRVKVEDVAGTVFGVRKDGEWKFYFQKRVMVTFFVNEQKLAVAKQSYAEWGKSFFDKSAYGKWWNPNWVKGQSWLTLTCAQFWPDGGGQAVVRI